MRRWLVGSLLTLIVAWITTVAILISREPSRGEREPAALAQVVQASAQEENSGDLARDIQTPGSEDDIARAFFDDVANKCGHGVRARFRQTSEQAGFVDLLKADGSRCTSVPAARNENGRWLIVPGVFVE